MKRIIPVVAIGLIIAAVGYISFVQANAQNPTPQSEVVAAGTPPSGFTRASGPVEWIFPDDHGPHTEYQTEWWYYSGNLETEDGRHFGFQLAFFRRGLVPDDQMIPRESNWATNQVYSAHFTLSDIAAQRYEFFERFGRGSAGITGAETDPYEVWVEDWVVAQTGESTYHLYAKQDDLVVDLSLEAARAPILHGDQGYFQKGADIENASYYYSIPRLESSGIIEISGEQFSVEGLSWMDHEFTTGSLTQDFVGWDWFSVQLSDGSELMLYQGRTTDGRTSPFSKGTLIRTDGSVIALSEADFEIEVETTWKSPHTEADYPARWSIRIPSQDLTLYIEPYMADQEQSLSFTYWEGAVKIEGDRNGAALTGVGYVELTGYAGGALGGRF
jgi:predicted secreted hydrolase